MSPGGQDFDAGWLALREPADHAARAGALEELLARALSDVRDSDMPLRVADLGAGTGSNLRHLAPRLGGRQHWTLLDADTRLLAAAPARLRPWAAAAGARVTARGEALEITGDGLDLSVDRRTADLSGDPLPAQDVHLVTAAALLDLVSRDWLERLALRCAAAGAAVIFALSYDGAISWFPPDAMDAAVVDLVNRHQRSGKGFGPALGPGAHAAAAQIFRAHGYRVEEARADWRLAASDKALQQHLHAGWAAAASETMPAWNGAIHAWLSRRMDALEAGLGTVTVGHMDLLALPERRA